MTTINLKPIKESIIEFTIVGITPLIQHAWDEKSIATMAEKHAGKKTKSREARVPEDEFKAATYFTEDGDYGIPALAFKTSLITAAHKDIGIEKTLVRKSLFVHCDDANGIMRMESSDPVMRQDTVRVGMKQTDLRYRPEFRSWAVTVTMEYDAEMLTPEDIINLVNRAGFGCGVGEWRPEKGGEFGRFRVDETQQVQAKAA